MPEVREILDTLGMSFRSYGHVHTLLCQPYTFAKDIEGPPFPLVLQMSLLQHRTLQKNNQVPYVQEISAMAVFVCQLMLGNFQ